MSNDIKFDLPDDPIDSLILDQEMLLNNRCANCNEMIWAGEWIAWQRIDGVRRKIHMQCHSDNKESVQ